MKIYFCSLIVLLGFFRAYAQELYVYTEPASNIPARAIAIRINGYYITNDNIYGRFSQRYRPAVRIGVSKKLELQLSGSVSDMHTSNMRIESGSFYAKYRFLSADKVHQHFRMAAFADLSATRAPFHYHEISLAGDKSGIGIGVVATQLIDKLAISASVSHLQVLDKSRTNKVLYIPPRSYTAMNYTLSAGYLLFPRQYNDFRQTNINLYGELLAQQLLDRHRYNIDFAPSIQFIFNSISRLNLGYRFQLSGDMDRMASSGFLVGYEYSFLNAWSRKK